MKSYLVDQKGWLGYIFGVRKSGRGIFVLLELLIEVIEI